MNYVLWGFHPSYVGKDGRSYLIRLAIGTLKECRAEQKYREKLGGWTLAMYAKDTDPGSAWLGLELEKFLETRAA